LSRARGFSTLGPPLFSQGFPLNPFRYQYAEVTDPNYPQLRNRAHPVLQWEIRDHKIKRVHILIQQSPHISSWFHYSQVTLYKSPRHFEDLVNIKYSRSLLARFLLGKTPLFR